MGRGQYAGVGGFIFVVPLGKMERMSCVGVYQPETKKALLNSCY